MPDSPYPPDTNDLIDFTPGPVARARHGGWSPDRQRRFVIALDAMGSVSQAAKAVGMSRISAYRLRTRPAAESFADAWDRALSTGRARQYDWAMDRAINGVTTIRLLRGGAVDVQTGADMRIVHAALREPPPKPI